MHFDKKSAVLILAFFLFYFCFGFYNFSQLGQVNNTQDFLFHYGTSKGIDSENNYWNSFLSPPNHDYPPAYHFITQFFAFNELVFYSVNLILIIVIIPLLILQLTKTCWSTILYFCGISFSHMAIFGATYPLMLVFTLVLIYFNYRKNPLVFVVLMYLAGLTHSKGIIIFFLILLAEILTYSIKQNALLGIGWLHQDVLDSPQKLVYALLFHLPIPLLYFGWKNKNWFYWILLTFGLLASFIEFRAIGLSQLTLLILASKPIQKTKNKVKLGLLLFLTFQTLYYILEFCLGTQKLILLN